MKEQKSSASDAMVQPALRNKMIEAADRVGSGASSAETSPGFAVIRHNGFVRVIVYRNPETREKALSRVKDAPDIPF